jgi:hypothetical protein
MDKKIDLPTLKAVLQDHLEDEQQARILKEIASILAEEEKEKEKKEKLPPIPKKPVVIITGGPEEIMKNPKILSELAGFITEIAEEDRALDIKYKLLDAKRDYDSSRKAKKSPAQSFGELFEVAPTKIFKNNGILKKPKGPLEFIFTNNK